MCLDMKDVDVKALNVAVHSFIWMDGDKMEVGKLKQKINVEVHVKSLRWVTSVSYLYLHLDNVLLYYTYNGIKYL